MMLLLGAFKFYLICLELLNLMKTMMGKRLASFNRLQMAGETPSKIQ